jgi:hypothetical protein
MATEFDSFEDFIRSQRDAGHTDLSPDQLVRQWQLQRRRLNGQNGTNASFADRLRKAGLLGSLEGGPDDLSSNSRHMEGFGS